MGKHKILIIAMIESIHTARWISIIDRDEWDVHLLPSEQTQNIHPKIDNCTIHLPLRALQKKQRNIVYRGILIPIFRPGQVETIFRIVKKIKPNFHSKYISKIVNELRPEIVHTLEMQHAGYLYLEAKKNIRYKPFWLYSCWGSDIFLFIRLAAHSERVKRVLESIDAIWTESVRDMHLAVENGFKGIRAPVIQATGGYDLNFLESLKISRPSTRTAIMVKGYQGWSGRALFSLAALEQCKDLLRAKEYTIYIHSAPDEVKIAAELLALRTRLKICVLPHQMSHKDMFLKYADCRLSLSLGISDGVPNSLLEAMATGCFPIQSIYSASDEWIDNNSTGRLVDPEDTSKISMAVAEALKDDFLVDKAAEVNIQLIKERLNSKMINKQVNDFYRTIITVLQ